MAAFKANSPVAAQGMNRNILDSQPNLFVKQTRKGWVQECFGCDANTEFKIATMQNPQENIMYATENTSCCIRFLCKNLRPFTITVSEGGQPGGKVHSFHERPCNLPLGNMKCCCYQQIVTKDSNGTVVGSVVEDCWYCVPSFKIINDSGMHEYNMHMPTCCCGMCVNCFSQGCCSCRLPFHFYVPGKEGEGEQVGEVVKIWSGLGKEILTDADNFELRFPTNADAACKTRLLGATFLVNQLFFER